MTSNTGTDRSLIDLFNRLKMRLKCDLLYCLEIRLKSDFQHWPSERVSKNGFFTEIRGTEPYPTKKALFGLFECALGYSDEHEDKKRELEEKIEIGTPVRTPYLYHADYEPGEIWNRVSWNNSFLGMRYHQDDVDISGAEMMPESNPEGRKYFFREMRGVQNKEKKTADGKNISENTIEIYISYDFFHSVNEATEISDIYSELKNEDSFTENISGLSFITMKNDRISVSFHGFRDSRLSIIICTQFDTEETREHLLGGFTDYKNLDKKRRPPYKRFYDFVTANRLFEWQEFQTADGEGKTTPPAMTKCVYLTDADFVVKVYGDLETLQSIADALDRPKFIYYFGKKTCRPARRVNQGIVEV